MFLFVPTVDFYEILKILALASYTEGEFPMSTVYS